MKKYISFFIEAMKKNKLFSIFFVMSFLYPALGFIVILKNAESFSEIYVISLIIALFLSIIFIFIILVLLAFIIVGIIYSSKKSTSFGVFLIVIFIIITISLLAYTFTSFLEIIFSWLGVSDVKQYIETTVTILGIMTAAIIPIIIMAKTNKSNEMNMKEQIRISVMPFLTITREDSVDTIHESIKIPNRYNTDWFETKNRFTVSLNNKSNNAIRDLYLKKIRYLYSIDNQEEVLVFEDADFRTEYKIAISQFGKVFIETPVPLAESDIRNKTKGSVYAHDNILIFRIELMVEFKDVLYNSYEQEFSIQNKYHTHDDVCEIEKGYFIVSDCAFIGQNISI